jgi:hypothetical protein
MASKEYVKPKCPKCGRTNVRYRASEEFKEKPFMCNLCGCEWKEEPESK